MKQFPICLLILKLSSQIVFAQGGSQLTQSQLANRLNTITTAVPFLMIAPDSRAGAMGDAGCASTPDVSSIYWNPTKNAFIEKNYGLSISYTPWLRALVPDINLFNVSGYKRIGKKNVVGFSGSYFSLGDITYSSITGTTTGTFRPYELCGSISFSHKMSHNFSLGIVGKYIYSDLTGGVITKNASTHPGHSLAMDISCYKRDTINFIKPNDVFAWGVNISNVGQKISYSNADTVGNFIPTNLRIGVSYKINIDQNNSVELICDANKLLVPTPPVYDTVNGNWVVVKGMDPNRSVFNALYTSFYDAPGGYQEELREIDIAGGIEYWYHKTVALRTGYFNEPATKGNRKFLTLGIGGRYSGFGLDLSYLIATSQRNPLQNTLRFTLLYEFNSF